MRSFVITMFEWIMGRSDQEPRAPEKGDDVLDKLLEQMDRKMRGLDRVVAPAPEAPSRTPFSVGVSPEEMSLRKFSLRQFAKVSPKITTSPEELQRTAPS